MVKALDMMRFKVNSLDEASCRAALAALQRLQQMVLKRLNTFQGKFIERVE